MSKRKVQEDSSQETPEDSVDSFRGDSEDGLDNYGVFQADYEFKFVQEGSDKTTLILPPVTYDSMEVAVFNIEMEVDSELHVSELEKQVTDSGTTKYILKIVKHILVPSEDVVEKEFGEDGFEIEYEDIADAAKGKGKKHKGVKTTPMDAHNYSKPKIIVKNAPEVKVENVDTNIVNETPKKSAAVSVTVALDGTQIDNDDGDDDDFDDFYNVDEEEDGDGDDDFEEMEIGETKTEPDSDEGDWDNDTPKPKRKKPAAKKPAAKKPAAKKPAAKKSPQDPDKKKRKYDKTSHYSKESSNFTLERTETGGRFFQCSLCPYMSKSSANMLFHARRHTGDKPFKCQSCDKAFVSTSALSAHQKVHTTERPFVCDRCGVGFKTATCVANHRIRHFQGKYECSICKKGFYSQYLLKEHFYTHTKEHPYACSECDKRFTMRSALKRHMLTHTGGNLKCHLCGKAFIRRDYWRSHMVKDHSYHENDELLAKKVTKLEKVVPQNASATPSKQFSVIKIIVPTSGELF